MSYLKYQLTADGATILLTTIANPKGGVYASEDNETGAIVIAFPASWAGSMSKLKIDVSQLTDNLSFALSCIGEAPDTTWGNCSAQIIGDKSSNNRVRFGYSGAGCRAGEPARPVIVIGDVSSIWTSPKVVISNFAEHGRDYDIGHINIDWDIQILDDLTGYIFDVDIPDALLDAKGIINQGDLATKNRSDLSYEDGADVTAEQFVQSLGSIDSATVNFDGRNDRDDSAIIAPAVATDGTAIDHTINTDSSADISFEWSWTGTESDIDGFVVYVRGSTSSDSYNFGTTPSEEITFYCRPDRRHFTLKGVAANLYWTFGVSAYRIVDPDVNTNGFIATAVIQPSASGEDPYRPSANVAFAGNITGTVNDQSVSSVVYHNGSVIKRTDGTGVDADSLPESTARKWAGESGATIGADWGSNINSQPKIFRIVSVGNAATSQPIGNGLYDEFNTLIASTSRSYNVDVYDRSTGAWDSHTVYDVFGDANNASTMASDLNNLDASKIVIIRTHDEPRNNRLTNDLPAAIYRCGGSRTIFASSNFKYRSAYILIGIPDIGEGNGIELYAGDVDSDANAWVETTITITSSGNIQLGNIKARDAIDISYADGTVVENLKPAQANADVTGDHSADVSTIATTFGTVDSNAITIQGKADAEAAMAFIAFTVTFDALIANDSNLSASKIAAIFNNSIFIVKKSASIIDDIDLSASKAASIINDVNLAVDRTASIIDNANLTVDRAASVINDDNLAVSRTASITNDANLAVNKIASIFDNTSFAASKAASIFDNTNLAIDKAASITNNANLAVSKAVSIFASTNLTVSRAASIIDNTNLAASKISDIFNDSNLAISRRNEIGDAHTRFLHIWITGNNLGTGRYNPGGCGTQTAGLAFGGYSSDYLASIEEYDGASWSTGGNLNTARDMPGGCGTQSAGLGFGGYNSSSGNLASTEEYDGTSWSSGGNLGTARYGLGGCGTQSAGLGFGGYNGSNYLTTTEEYDGTSWSSGGNLGTARYLLGGCGTQSAGLSFGGSASGTSLAVTEEYNGSSWSAGGNLNTARYGLGGCGTQTAGLSFGGNHAVTEEYNGYDWGTSGTSNNPGGAVAGCGTQSVGLSFGGGSSTREYW